MSLEGLTILLIEDDPNVRRLLPRYLQRAGATTLTAAGALEGLDLAKESPPDLVLLDVNLPDIDGWSVLKRLRQQHGYGLGVIMLTGRSDVPDRLLGLELGADDYIVKPFEPEEVVARTHAVMRRILKPGHNQGPSAKRPPKGVYVDQTARTVYVDGAEIMLTTKEFDLLAALWSQEGRVVSREALARYGWPDDEDVDPHAIDVFMSRIRTKLGPAHGTSAIVTVRGVGYRFDAVKSNGSTSGGDHF